MLNKYNSFIIKWWN